MIRAWVFAWVALAAVASSGCKDEGVERFKKARGQYDQLIDKATPLSDPAFAEVRRELEAVPKDSEARADAEKLLSALSVNARTLPPRPLAFAPTRDAGTIAHECVQLAEALGRADAGVDRERVLEALKKCRLEQERAHAHEHAEDEPPH